MERIVLIGAGSQQFGLGTISDIFKSKILEGSTIVLHDVNDFALAKTKRIADQFKEELKAKYTVEATSSRKEALRGATVCIISIEIGKRFDLWDQDWKIPLQYGFKQIYGENGGPGGLFHSLRIIPPILEICDDINKICPEAFVFNFSNPMQRICHAVTTKFPELKFYGLCHEIASMERQLPALMETSIHNIEFKAGGLNHLSILLEATYKDSKKDAYPIIRNKFETFYSRLINYHDGFCSEPGAERGVFFEIFKSYGYLPITTDSHLGEYLPWAYSVADHGAILHFYDNYKIESLKPREGAKDYAHFFNMDDLKFHERVVPVMEGILNDTGDMEAAVNVPNKGFIEELPDGIVVEVPGNLQKRGVDGIKLQNYPKSFAALLNLQVSTIKLTTDAAINKSFEVAFSALLSDPVVDNAKSAKKLLKKMINVQEPFLGYLK